MATINEIIQSAVDRVKLKGSETWIKWSFWTRAKDVELNSGKNVEIAVSELDENISNEIDRATDRENEIETALNSEITRAKSAESTLSTSINNEIIRAKNAENTLETNKVPITRTINGKALSSDITLSASDVGADASGSANTALRNAKAYTDTKVADLVGTAPETLDTLEELADALKDNADIVDVLNEAITSKASAVDLTSHTSNNTAHITADERTAWNDANNKKHEHTNKTILDNTTASYTTEEKEKLSGIKDGAESTATTTSGSNPTVTNSADAQLIYGKIAGYTVQDGVPTPDNPIDIQGLGDSGSVEVKTCGKNLLTHSLTSGTVYDLTTKLNDDGSLTFTGTTTNQITHHLDDIISRLKVGETYIWSGVTNVKIVEDGTNLYKSGGGSYTITENTTTFIPYFQWGADATLNTTYYPMVRIKGTDDSYEPYAETTATIPIDAPFYDGDYIEVYADGSGKIVRTMGKKVITSSDYVDMPHPNAFRYVIHEGYDSSGSYTDRKLKGYSNRFAIKQSYDDMTIYDAILETVNNDGWGGNIRATITMPTSFNTKELMNEFVDNNEVYFIYPLKESVETELTAEQVQAFKQLYTFDNVTNFFCDGEITARYYVNTDSGDTVGMLHKSISDLQEVGSESSIGLTKLYTGTGTNTDGSMTQNAITTALNGKASKYEWTATVKGQTWSRIFQVKTSVSVIGNSGILNVSFTRGNVVCNATFMITTSHKNKCFITQLSANSYSPFKIRGVANTHGDAYIELYDYTASISTATEQAVYCRFIPLRVNTVNVYTEFVDGTTVPTDYTANDPLTVDITGGSMVASKFVGDLSGNATSSDKLSTARDIKVNLGSTNAASFDGSGDATVGVTGTLGAGNGGTGKTTLQDSANALINSLERGSSEPQDNDYFVSQYAGGTQNTFYRRPVSALWGYIKGKISSVLGISTSGWKLSGSTANVDAFITAERTDTGVSVAFGVGSGGTNHGLWSNKLDKWMVYGDASNVYLNGDAATATKLKTARTINNTSFDGSANIRTADSWNFSFGQNNTTAAYRIFAKMKKTNTTGNGGATFLITDGGNFGMTHTGAWLVQISNRGSEASMYVRVLESSSGYNFRLLE